MESVKRRFQSMEFLYDSNSTTPYVSAPSSPPGRSPVTNSGGFYFSAPTSPTRSAAILSEFAESTRAVVPFVWEEKPGIAKKNGAGEGEGEERESQSKSIGNGSEFEFSARFSVGEGGADSEGPGLLSTADELFCNGQIRPLRLPPRLLQPARSPGFDFDFSISTSQSPRSPIKEGRRILKEALAGLSKGAKDKDDFDPFAAALNEARKEERGRERSPSRRRTRSLSPLRIFHWEEPRKSDAHDFFSTELQNGVPYEEEEEVKSSIPPKPKGTRRWSLKDFLFRSASEGRAQCKDRLWGLSIPPAKHSDKHKSSAKLLKPNVKRGQQEDLKSFHGKSADNISGKKQEDFKTYAVNPRSGSFSNSGRKMPISPHELHYTANRAQSEELRKRTFLPYRQGLLGCLGLSSKGYTAMNGLARSLNVSS